MDGLESAISIKGTISNNSDIDTSWICEMALPFSEMQFAASSMNYPPLVDDIWRFNLYRFGRSYTNNSVGEATGWSQTEGGQHEPDRFGEIKFGDILSDVIEHPKKNNLGENFGLQQNYPNPFNPSTQIKYILHNKDRVSIKVYNMLGQHVKTLFDDFNNSGNYTVTWNGENRNGVSMPTGIYFCNMKNVECHQSKKMLLIR